MKLGLYPGSFFPFHSGHEDILNKALEVFDHIVICRMINPDKESNITELDYSAQKLNKLFLNPDSRITVLSRDRTLKSVIDSQIFINSRKYEYSAIIRGLRNGDDLQYEMNSQYWNEDVGIKVPFVYFITDRALSHVSSSVIRMVDKLGLKHEYTV